MAGDLLTMMWKERKSMFRYQGSRTRYLLLVMSPLLLATIFPVTWGPDWLAQLPPLILSTLMAVVLVATMVPESFAGERERHTLETLLASRLPDRAILFGKLILPLAMGWAMGLLVLAVSLIAVNVAHWSGGFLFYTPTIFLGSLALSLLMATLTAGLGVFVSLRTRTAQEATQMLVAIILIPPMLLQVIPLLFRDQIGPFIESVNGPQLLMIVLAVLAVVDVLVLLATMARFRRSRLILG